jgi:hypothetical protein
MKVDAEGLKTALVALRKYGPLIVLIALTSICGVENALELSRCAWLQG